MPRSIDEIELHSTPLHAYWSELDRDTALALEIHIIECLRLHLTLLEGSRDLHETISKSRLPMIDMGDDTEVADGSRLGHRGARKARVGRKTRIAREVNFFSYFLHNIRKNGENAKILHAKFAK
jgi:hypothetical protein